MLHGLVGVGCGGVEGAEAADLGPAQGDEEDDEDTFRLLGGELGYDIRMVSPEEEERELFDSFNIDLEIGVDTEDEDDLSVKRRLPALERELIARALDRTGGNRTRAAELLDLSTRALTYKIQEYGLT